MPILPLAGREEYEPPRLAISGAERVGASDRRRNLACRENHPGRSAVGPQKFPDAEKLSLRRP
jgi:hypothetical protein